jgi:hypothetical protein
MGTRSKLSHCINYLLPYNTYHTLSGLRKCTFMISLFLRFRNVSTAGLSTVAGSQNTSSWCQGCSLIWGSTKKGAASIFYVVIGSIVFWGLWGWGPFLTVCLFLQGQEGRISLENGYYNIIKNNHVYVNSYILSLLFFYQVSVSTLRKGGNYIKGWIPRGRDCGSHHKSVHAVNWPHLYFKLGSGGKVNQKDEESILSH